MEVFNPLSNKYVGRKLCQAFKRDDYQFVENNVHIYGVNEGIVYGRHSHTSLLRIAINYDAMNCVKVLLDAGANINDRSPFSGGSLLTTICQFEPRLMDIVFVLLEYGADTTGCDHGWIKKSLTLEIRLFIKFLCYYGVKTTVGTSIRT